AYSSLPENRMYLAKRFALLAALMLFGGCGDKNKTAETTLPDSTAASAAAPPVAETVAPVIVNMPPNLDTPNNRAQLIDTMHNLDLSDSQFDPSTGETYEPGTGDESIIQPHRGSRDGGKVHGKLLARIRVKK